MAFDQYSAMIQEFLKFVKRFAEVGSVMKEAFANYIKEVQAETYPAEEHTFKIDDEVLEKLY